MFVIKKIKILTELKIKLKTETKSFADCFLKTVPLGVAEGSQCHAELQEGYLNQKSLPDPKKSR